MCVLEIRFIPRRNTNLGEVLIDKGLDRELEEITGADWKGRSLYDTD